MDQTDRNTHKKTLIKLFNELKFYKHHPHVSGSWFFWSSLLNDSLMMLEEKLQLLTVDKLLEKNGGVYLSRLKNSFTGSECKMYRIGSPSPCYKFHFVNAILKYFQPSVFSFLSLSVTSSLFLLAHDLLVTLNSFSPAVIISFCPGVSHWFNIGFSILS